MSYDPFSRGPHPVGVRSVVLHDAARDRSIPVELWYPAAAEHRGADLSHETQDRYGVLPGFPPVAQEAVRDATVEQPGRFPLVVFSHGFGGHRRQTTFLCTHLASHGYVVAAPDHVGNTITDMMQAVLEVAQGRPLPDTAALLHEFAAARPADAIAAIDQLLTGQAGDLAAHIDESRIGITGHSFGGWTTLAVASRDPRVRAALPLAPAGGRTPLPADPLRELLDLSGLHDVPTFFLVAEHDTLLPLDGMHELLERTPGPSRMAILEQSDHMHFCDRVEETHEMFRLMPKPPLFSAISNVPPMAGLVPGEHAYDFVRGLGLAHFDAVLREHEAAARLLEQDLAALLAARGVKIRVV